jgi:hypothetical protein
MQMTNDECQLTKEIPMTNTEENPECNGAVAEQRSILWILEFELLSSFGIRHSSFLPIIRYSMVRHIVPQSP